MRYSDLAVRAVEVLRRKGMTLATAESCTGGGIAKAITDVAGSSAAFCGGFVAYHNDVKISVLGVDSNIIDRETEVSHACAKAMADAAGARMGASLAVSTTGYAGPGGGTERNPVGTVYIGVWSGRDCFSERFSAPKGSSREEIREAAIERALELVLQVAELY